MSSNRPGEDPLQESDAQKPNAQKPSLKRTLLNIKPLEAGALSLVLYILLFIVFLASPYMDQLDTFTFALLFFLGGMGWGIGVSWVWKRLSALYQRVHILLPGRIEREQQQLLEWARESKARCILRKTPGKALPYHAITFPKLKDAKGLAEAPQSFVVPQAAGYVVISLQPLDGDSWETLAPLVHKPSKALDVMLADEAEYFAALEFQSPQVIDLSDIPRALSLEWLEQATKEQLFFAIQRSSDNFEEFFLCQPQKEALLRFDICDLQNLEATLNDFVMWSEKKGRMLHKARHPIEQYLYETPSFFRHPLAWSAFVCRNWSHSPHTHSLLHRLFCFCDEDTLGQLADLLDQNTTETLLRPSLRSFVLETWRPSMLAMLNRENEEIDPSELGYPWLWMRWARQLFDVQELLDLSKELLGQTKGHGKYNRPAKAYESKLNAFHDSLRFHALKLWVDEAGEAGWRELLGWLEYEWGELACEILSRLHSYPKAPRGLVTQAAFRKLERESTCSAALQLLARIGDKQTAAELQQVIQSWDEIRHIEYIEEAQGVIELFLGNAVRGAISLAEAQDEGQLSLADDAGKVSLSNENPKE